MSDENLDISRSAKILVYGLENIKKLMFKIDRSLVQGYNLAILLFSQDWLDE
jgi:hypothetical protein